MARTVILFEDHTAQQFRPLSWSLPVHELPCGLFNLRERLGLLLPDGARLGFLPRGYLADLLGTTLGDGAPVGPAACGGLDDEDVLFLSARLGPDAARLTDVVDELAPGAGLSDGHGLLAWRGSGRTAREVLDHWTRWDREATESSAWSLPTTPVTPWAPPIDATETDAAPAYLWDLIPLIGPAIASDLDLLGEGERRTMPSRLVFGALPEAESPFLGTTLRRVEDPPAGVHLQGDGGLWLGDGVSLAPGVAVDTAHGPVVIDHDVRVMPHVYLEGPLYLGCGTRVKAGATLYGETAVGGVCRVSGEIAESQLLPYMNKQHAGFLGHAVVGSWTNLGADTTNSDLKNNYGEIKVNFGLGPVETGSRFVGLMMAEHAKSAIGTTFNTGTTVGFASNVFAAGFPRTCLANYTWGDGRGRRSFRVERALEVARVVMGRRGCRFTEAHAALFRFLAS